MKKLITLVLSIGAFIGVGAIGAPSALAANSTCATHSNNGDPIHAFLNAPLEWFTQGYDFKCGGANNEDFRIDFQLQYKSDTGVWHDGKCLGSVSSQCEALRPTTVGNWFDGGTEHSGKVDRSDQYQGWSSLDTNQNKFCGSSGASLEHLNWRTAFTVIFRDSSPLIAFVESITIPESLC